MKLAIEFELDHCQVNMQMKIGLSVFDRNSVKNFSMALIVTFQNPALATGLLEKNAESSGQTSQSPFDWLGFNPQNFKFPKRLVPAINFVPERAAVYKRGSTFTHDPTRTSVIYGRGSKNLPTEIYTKAFDVLLLDGKLYQAPGAGEAKAVNIRGNSILIYGTSFYTPVPGNKFVANPVQVAPFNSENIFYNDKSVWPAIIYGEAGSEVTIANHKFKFPANGESITIVFGADGKPKTNESTSTSEHTRNEHSEQRSLTHGSMTSSQATKGSESSSMSQAGQDNAAAPPVQQIGSNHTKLPAASEERHSTQNSDSKPGESITSVNMKSPMENKNIEHQLEASAKAKDEEHSQTSPNAVKLQDAKVDSIHTSEDNKPSEKLITEKVGNGSAKTPEPATDSSRYVSKVQVLSNGASNEYINDTKTGKQYAVIIRDAAGNVLGCSIYDADGQITPAYSKPAEATTYAGDSYIGIWYKPSGEPVGPVDKNLIQGPRGWYDPRFRSICLETGLPTDSAGNYLAKSVQVSGLATPPAVQNTNGVLPPSFGTQSNPLVWSNSVDGKYYNTQGIIKGTYALNELSSFGYSMLDGGGKLVSIDSVASASGGATKTEAPKQMTFIGLDGKVTSVASGQGLFLDAKGNPTVYNKGDNLHVSSTGAVTAVAPNQNVFIDTKGNTTVYNNNQNLIIGVNGTPAAVTKGQTINIGAGGNVINNELAPKATSSTSKYNFFDAAAGPQGRQLADKWLSMPQEQFNQTINSMRAESKTGTGYIADSTGLAKLTDAQLQTLYRTTTPDGQSRLKQIIALEGNQFGINSNNEGTARVNSLFGNDWSKAVDPNIVPVQKVENGLMSWGTNSMRVSQQPYNGAGQKWVDPQGQSWEFGQNGALAQGSAGIVKGTIAEVTAGKVSGSSSNTEYWANPFNYGTDRPYFGDNPQQGTQKVGLSVNRDNSLGFGSNTKAITSQLNLNQIFDNSGHWVDPSRLSPVADNPLLMKDKETGATLDLQSGEWKDSPEIIGGAKVTPTGKIGNSTGYVSYSDAKTIDYQGRKIPLYGRALSEIEFKKVPGAEFIAELDPSKSNCHLITEILVSMHESGTLPPAANFALSNANTSLSKAADFVSAGARLVGKPESDSVATSTLVAEPSNFLKEHGYISTSSKEYNSYDVITVQKGIGPVADSHSFTVIESSADGTPLWGIHQRGPGISPQVVNWTDIQADINQNWQGSAITHFQKPTPESLRIKPGN